MNKGSPGSEVVLQRRHSDGLAGDRVCLAS